MRFNKQELLTLATQPSQKFDKEGILFLRERQEGFFRRTEISLERWCRLRGNLLFYFKSQDRWSEPMGVIILEQCTMRIDPSTPDGPYGFTLVFEGGMGQHLATNTEEERDEWLEAMRVASYTNIRTKLLELQQKVEMKRGHDPHLDVHMWRLRRGNNIDPSELPLCEVSLSCDNLLCDGHGRPPNPVVIIHVFLPTDAVWLKYSNTEVIQRSSNPTFLSTVTFRSSDGLSPESRIRFSAFDVRETVSQTATPIGNSCVTLSSLQENERLRIPLKGHCGSTVGFLSLSVWSLEREETNPSTESTPLRSIPHSDSSVFCHRRSQSLPPRFGCKLRLPHQGAFKMLFGNATVQTYRFHSGLGGDISVHEVMAESKLCFQFPQQLLSLWINEEKELLQEVAGMGELVEPWHSLQVELLDRHLHLLHLYSQAKENLQAHKGSFFKESSRKNDRSLEFAPVNLHLQRMWVQNETLKKCDFYDIITVGAFTAHSHRSKNGGLIKLLQQLKELAVKGENGTPGMNKIEMAHDAIQAIKQIRREVVEGMRTLMRLAKDKKTIGMLPICDDMIAKTRTLLNLWDPGLVEEALSFVEEHKVGVVDDSMTVGGTLAPTALSPFKRITQGLLFSQETSGGAHADPDDLVTPDSPRCLHTFWHPPPPPPPLSSSDQFVIFPDAELDHNSNNNHKLADCTQIACEETDGDKCCTEEDKLLAERSGEIGKKFLDTHAMCSSPSANYYKPSEEPEPWDLTQLNIEASVMCLVSKVKFLCGRCSSPAVRIRSTQKIIGRSQSFRSELCSQEEAVTSQPNSSATLSRLAQSSVNPITDDKIKQAVQSVTAVRNKFTEGLELSTLTDWTVELRPSMRKLRQAMDGLLKTARLTHSVFRLQEDRRQAQRACNLRYRRHVCFSHALTALVTGLMAKLWCQKSDPIFLETLTKVGPLVSFEGLLSYHGDEIDMWGDMVVAIEDLRTVTFTITHSHPDSKGGEWWPRVIGSRSALTVVLPVPDWVSPLTSFHVTPVFFNVGINEMASLAESLGATRPQEKSNLDNFSRLNEYYRRYRKLGMPIDNSSNRRQSSGGGGSAKASLLDLIKKLRNEVSTSKSKNVNILQLSAHICRRMRGIRLTSCKSAKDRTGMSVSLEQASILTLEYDLAEHEFHKALDCMRSEGCRRENTVKNTGVRKYAFNSLQLLTLPTLYRPPPGTYGSAQS